MYAFGAHHFITLESHSYQGKGLLLVPVLQSLESIIIYVRNHTWTMFWALCHTCYSEIPRCSAPLSLLVNLGIVHDSVAILNINAQPKAWQATEINATKRTIKSMFKSSLQTTTSILFMFYLFIFYIQFHFDYWTLVLAYWNYTVLSWRQGSITH